MNKKVIIYYSKCKDNSVPICFQKDGLKSICKKKKYKVTDVISNMDKLKSKLKANCHLNIYVYALQCIFKNIIILNDLIELIANNDHKVHSYIEKLEVNKDNCKLLKAAIANFTVNSKDLKTIKGRPKFGKDLKLNIDESNDLSKKMSEDDIVQYMKAFRAKGYSYRKIADELHALGIRSKQGLEHWHPNTVRRVILTS